MKPVVEPDLLHLLFPHVRAEILRMLFFSPKRGTYGSEAARATTFALRTVQRELSILEAAGLVTSRRKGSYRLFRANRGHRLFPALQQLVIKGASDQPFVSKAKNPASRGALRPCISEAIKDGIALTEASRRPEYLDYDPGVLKRVTACRSRSRIWLPARIQRTQINREQAATRSTGSVQAYCDCHAQTNRRCRKPDLDRPGGHRKK